MNNIDLWTQIEAARPLESPEAFSSCAYDDDSSERLLGQQDRRRSFIARYSWAVPTRQAISAIATFVGCRRVLEVCAGAGLWSRLLRDHRIDVLATDAEPNGRAGYVPVERFEAEEAVRSHRERNALLLIWPPFKTDCALRALHAFHGDRLVYVGDVRFTGEARFHDLLAEEWELQVRLLIPAWPGFDDYVYLYLRGNK